MTKMANMINIRHVIPVNDPVTHTNRETCICMPSVDTVRRQDGTDAGWIYIHHPLDGREQREQQ